MIPPHLQSQIDQQVKDTQEQALRSAGNPPEKVETFEAHGQTWFRHTPGDTPPIDKKTAVRILDRDSKQYPCDDKNPWDTVWWSDRYINPIIGWRYATPQPQEPDELATLRAIVAACMKAMPCGNIATHTPENLAGRIEELAQLLATESLENDTLRADRELMLAAIDALIDAHNDADHPDGGKAFAALESIRTNWTPMSTPPPNYDEPWTFHEDMTSPAITDSQGVAIIDGADYEVKDDRLKRAVLCVNALEGIPDPGAAITAAREALAACQHSDVCAVNLCLGSCDCGKERALELLNPTKPAKTNKLSDREWAALPGGERETNSQP